MKAMKLDIHPQRARPEGFEVNASLEFDPLTRRVSAGFSLRFPPISLRIPNLKGIRPDRQDQLWEHTCFEVYFREAGSTDRYWELNFSPFGDWNVYVFSSYRKGMAPETGIDAVTLEELELSEESCVCRFSFSLENLSLVQAHLNYGLTAVVESESGEISYWAQVHASAEPDFHLPESHASSLSLNAP